LYDVAVCVTVIVYRLDVLWVSNSVNVPLVLYGCDTSSVIRKHFSISLRMKIHDLTSLVVKIRVPLISQSDCNHLLVLESDFRLYLRKKRDVTPWCQSDILRIPCYQEESSYTFRLIVTLRP
jgi:hypothetical protein